MEEEMDESFGRRLWPAGIRSVVPGSYLLINVGTTPEAVDVYLYASGLDPRTLDISLQQNLLTVAGERTQSVERQTPRAMICRFS